MLTANVNHDSSFPITTSTTTLQSHSLAQPLHLRLTVLAIGSLGSGCCGVFELLHVSVEDSVGHSSPQHLEIRGPRGE